MKTPSNIPLMTSFNKPALSVINWAKTHGMGAKDVFSLGFHVLRTVALMGAIIFFSALADLRDEHELG